VSQEGEEGRQIGGCGVGLGRCSVSQEGEEGRQIGGCGVGLGRLVLWRGHDGVLLRKKVKKEGE